MEKGIRVNNLFAESIFEFKFEFDDWPQAHTDLRKMIRPYNGGIFEIRNAYRKVFNDIPDPDMYKEKGKKEKSKYYKITYHLNMIMNVHTESG